MSQRNLVPVILATMALSACTTDVSWNQINNLSCEPFPVEFRLYGSIGLVEGTWAPGETIETEVNVPVVPVPGGEFGLQVRKPEEFQGFRCLIVHIFDSTSPDNSGNYYLVNFNEGVEFGIYIRRTPLELIFQSTYMTIAPPDQLPVVRYDFVANSLEVDMRDGYVEPFDIDDVGLEVDSNISACFIRSTTTNGSILVRAATSTLRQAEHLALGTFIFVNSLGDTSGTLVVIMIMATGAIAIVRKIRRLSTLGRPAWYNDLVVVLLLVLLLGLLTGGGLILLASPSSICLPIGS